MYLLIGPAQLIGLVLTVLLFHQELFIPHQDIVCLVYRVALTSMVEVYHLTCKLMRRLKLKLELSYVLIQEEFVPLLQLVHA